MKIVTEFTVVRSKWTGRDGYRGRSSLYTELGDACCLGFMCEAAGVDRDDMVDVAMPQAIGTVDGCPFMDVMRLPCAHLDEDAPVFQAADINDDTTINQADREQKLTSLFAKHGVKINFVD